MNLPDRLCRLILWHKPQLLTSESLCFTPFVKQATLDNVACSFALFILSFLIIRSALLLRAVFFYIILCKPLIYIFLKNLYFSSLVFSFPVGLCSLQPYFLTINFFTVYAFFPILFLSASEHIFSHLAPSFIFYDTYNHILDSLYQEFLSFLCLLPSGSPTRQLSNIRTDLGIYILLHLPQSVLDSN